MSLALVWLCAVHTVLAPQAASLPNTLVPWPSDVSGYTQGAAAVATDPALSAAALGAELSLRRVGQPQQGGLGAVAAAATLPLFSRLAVFGGIEAQRLWSPNAHRTTIGTGVRISERLYVGVDVRALWWQRYHSRSYWDAAVAWSPTRLARISLGIDAINAPTWPGLRPNLPRTLRLGIALRPLFGSPRLSVAFEARVRHAQRLRVPQLRAWLAASPTANLQTFVAWDKTAGEHRLWVGLDVAAWLGRFTAAGLALPAAPVAARLGVGAVLRQTPPHTPRPWGRAPVRVVSMHLYDKLREGGPWPWSAPAQLSLAAARLHALAGDVDVQQVLLDVDTLQVGMASIDELSAAILALRAAGKEVVVRLLQADARTYALAAHASRVHIDPSGQIDLAGFVSKRMYWADVWAIVGIHFEAVGIGRAKSGADGWTRNAPRAGDTDMRVAVLQQAQATLRQALCAQRGLCAADADALLQEGLFDAARACAIGLVDTLEPEVDVARGVVRAAPQAPAVPAPQGMVATAHSDADAWAAPDVLAVVPIVGVLADADAGAWQAERADADAIEQALYQAADSPRVRGIVVRIDSPGGDVLTAERLWRAVKYASRKKPLVASLGDVAASGGYYIAAAAPQIVAAANSVTGSIGIYRLKGNFAGLWQLLGAKQDVATAGAHAGWDSQDKPWSDADRLRVGRSLQGFYDAFVARVAQGRALPLAKAQDLAQGQIFTGCAAKALGLVDAIGGLHEAAELLRAQLPERIAADAPLQVFAGRAQLRLLSPAMLLGAAQAAPHADFAALLAQPVQATSLLQWLQARPLALCLQL